MSTEYPAALDALPADIGPNTREDAEGYRHSEMHNRANAAINALQELVGTGEPANTVLERLDGIEEYLVEQTTDDLAEGDNKFYTDARADARVGLLAATLGTAATTDATDYATAAQGALAEAAVQEAPADGKAYARKNGAWEEVAGEGGLNARATAVISSGTGAAPIGRSSLLVELQASAPARCRFYGTEAARDADADRSAGVAPPQGSGLILEFIATAELLGAPLVPAPLACNLDDPVDDVIYYTITPDAGAMTIDLTYLPLGN